MVRVGRCTYCIPGVSAVVVVALSVSFGRSYSREFVPLESASQQLSPLGLLWFSGRSCLEISVSPLFL